MHLKYLFLLVCLVKMPLLAFISTLLSSSKVRAEQLKSQRGVRAFTTEQGQMQHVHCKEENQVSASLHDARGPESDGRTQGERQANHLPLDRQLRQPQNVSIHNAGRAFSSERGARSSLQTHAAPETQYTEFTLAYRSADPFSAWRGGTQAASSCA